MPRATLVVHDFSLPYVQRFVDYLHGVLRRHVDPSAHLAICDDIDKAEYPDGLVLVIGETFQPFRRRAGCRYVFLNLSVVTVLGSPFSASLGGYRQIFRKRRMLAAKLTCFDILLDYYAPQTEVLRRQLSVPVFGFDVAIPPTDTLHIAERDYDVCFVGGLTARRQVLLDKIAEAGFTLSPNSGAPIEDIAARSKCCLNVHSERSNHLEVPRLLAALSTGCPVVTERSFGLEGVAAGPFVKSEPYNRLLSGVTDVLRDADHLQFLAEAAADWYQGTYLPQAEKRWRVLFEAMETDNVVQAQAV